MFAVDQGEGVDNGQNVGLNLKIVLCNINRNDSMGPIRGNEPFEEDPVFLT